MPFRPYRQALVAAFLASSSMAAAQEEPRYEPTPAWVDMATLPAAPAQGKSVILLIDSQTKIEADRQIDYIDRAYHIVAPEMLSQAGNVSVEWQPEVQDAVVHSVEIIRDGKTIDALDGGRHFEILRRETQLDQQTIDGVLTATMQLTGLQVDDVVRVRFSLISSDPALGGKAAGLTMLPVAPLMIDQYRFRLIWPEGDGLRWTAEDAALFTDSKHDGLEEIRFEGILPKRKDQPQDAPMRFVRPPAVNYSTFPDWPSVSRSVAKLYDERAKLDPDGPLAKRVQQMAASHSSQMERMAAAIALVQGEVRYLYRGMDFGNYTPQTPADTWDKRYGDCKAKSLLLLTILRELGIEAEPMLVRSAQGDVISDLLPGLYAFDHVVVRAKVDGADYWLDGTTQGTTLDNINEVANFFVALPLTASGSDLVDVPVRPLSMPMKSVSRAIDLSAGIGFPALVDITMTLRGPLISQFKAAQANLDEASFDDFVDSLLASTGNDGAVFERSVDMDEEGLTATLSGRAIETYYWQWKNRRYQTSLGPPVENFTFDADRGRAAWADIPVVVDHPQYLSSTFRLQLPDLGASFTLDGQTQFDGDIAGIQFHHDYAMDGNLLKGTIWQRSIATEVPAQQLPQIRTELARAKAHPAILLVPDNVKSKALFVLEHASSKAVDELKAAYDRLVAQSEPDETWTYRNRASFLAGIGNHAAAAADIEHILTLEPSVEDYLWHAMMVETDDPEAALQSIAKARELDPASSGTLERMAKILWLHDRPAELLSAADAFESLGVEKKTVDMVRATALAQAKRQDEALALLDAALEDKPGDAQLYRARCSLKATYGLALDSALKDCTRASELSEDSYSALEDRGLAYWRLGRKDAAVEDWTSALISFPDAPHARYFLGMAEGGQSGARKQRQAMLMDPELKLELGNWAPID